MVDEGQKPHAILVSYPLQGHVNPSVHLAIHLASRGFTITFINTLSIHRRIIAAAAASSARSGDIFAGIRHSSGLDIRYATVSDGLPVGLDRSPHSEQFESALLHELSAHVEKAVERLVRDSKPTVTCLIADTYFVWPGKLAKRYGLSYVSFWTEAALVFTLYYHMDLLRLNGHFDSLDKREDEINYIPGVQSIKPKDLTSYLKQTDTSTLPHQIINRAFDDVRTADYVLCNTIQELEPETISTLNQKIPFFAIGPILSHDTDNIISTSLWPESDCTHWLDSRPPGSVLYISFGSYAHISKNDLTEIAHGLLLSDVDFLWALRPGIVGSDEESPLPEEARQGRRGLVVEWCCQRRVLAHEAVGGFLTHCGWNSVLESVWFRVPMLCFPLYTDQFTNRKLVVDDWEIGMNLCDEGRVDRFEVAENVRKLMNEIGVRVGEVGRVKRVLEKALADSGSSEENMGMFVKEMREVDDGVVVV
ncbi:UDP-Glycosyltransferase superfamily protein [Striga asiatica]|uniref:Glycosyltransferase n=1 Tax=Striga asiatica TaxID=4170 RepID=A0A5A7P7I5_STRAF|nr:UDP-Glycosyltransferase superfamily protein [Striga asiatica]